MGLTSYLPGVGGAIVKKILTFKGYDYTLIITPILLAGFGVMMIYSASMVSTVVGGLDSTFYLFRQLRWFVLGLIGFVFCCIFPYKTYQKLIVPLIIGSIALLFLTLWFGDTVNRATRSIDLFGFNIQPSEFIKLSLIIYLAAIYAKKQSYIGNFKKGVLPPLYLTAFIIILIIKQPDIGTAAIILLTVSTIIISSGMKLKHIGILMTVCIGLIAI